MNKKAIYNFKKIQFIDGKCYQWNVKKQELVEYTNKYVSEKWSLKKIVAMENRGLKNAIATMPKLVVKHFKLKLDQV